MSRSILLASAVAALAALSNALWADKPCTTADFEVFSEGFKFPEGPAFDAAGNLYVVAYQKESDIARIAPDGKTTVFLDLGAVKEGAANGMAFNPADGKLYACEYEGKRIIAIDLASKKVETVVDSYRGKPLNEVNDIFLAANGDLYFSDPNREDETTGGRVLCCSIADKKIYLLAEGLAFPNGLTVSRDMKTLYVAQTVRRNVTAYPLTDNGHKAGPGKEIFLMSGGNGPDGIEEDERGNLFITHYGGGRLYYVSPQGKLLGCAGGFGANLTNVQANGDWVYITEAEKGQVLRVKRSHFMAP